MFAVLVIAMGIAPPFELKDGDRVVWIGSAVAEREQKYGYWETALLCQWPDRKITFRNLGWSGDTVEGIARAGFDPPAMGYERLVKSVKAENPTVIFVSYGAVEAIDGNLAKNINESKGFETKLEKLLDDVKSTKARIVLFTPMPFDEDWMFKKQGLKVIKNPNPGIIIARGNATNNNALRVYADCIRAVGEQSGHRLADLNKELTKHFEKSDSHFTEDGLQLSESGYEGTIPDLFTSLGLSWAGHDPKKFDAVRKAVVMKNELYFHQWRPQNETYLFGFRKHEQGNNAKEVKEFNTLIEKAEADIAAALKTIK